MSETWLGTDRIEVVVDLNERSPHVHADCEPFAIVSDKCGTHDPLLAHACFACGFSNISVFYTISNKCRIETVAAAAVALLHHQRLRCVLSQDVYSN